MTMTRKTALLTVALLAALVGCTGEETPTGPASPTVVSPATQVDKSLSANVINGYEVRFDGRMMREGDTQFVWTVRGTGGDPALSHFMVQLPACAGAPVAYQPTGSVSINTNPHTGIYGLEWHLEVASDDTTGRMYSITFPGNVPLGEVYSSVISGNTTEVGIIPGPCQGYDISGRVFVDANENGLRDPDEESGIANVVIELTDEFGNVSSLPTDEFGDYSFRKLEGAFTVSLALDGHPGYFNGSLAESFDPTTVLGLEAAVPPDSPGNDFGFSPRAEELIFDLESGVLLSDGESRKFWKSEFRSASGNGRGNAVFGAAQLLGFLAEVQALFLADPYTFTPGNEIQEAFDLLRSNSKEPLDLLLAELLATELNQVAGRGLVGQEDLQLVLIAWGEALVAEGQATTAAGYADGSGIDTARTTATPTQMDQATELFSLINTGGGGGVDE